MTGYGRAVETVNGREFTVELRSVNNRYLDCTVKMPRSLSFAEEAVKQAVSRGKVDVFITVKSENADDTKISLNTAVVEGYLSAMRQLVSDYGVKDDISVSVLSRMNDVCFSRVTAGFSSYDGEFRLPLVLAQASPIFHSSCEGKLGIALE